MADIFQLSDARRLLRDKYVIFLGDSNCRALYKDLVWLLNSNSLIEGHVLKRKLEFSYLGDELVERSQLTKGRDFKEARLFNMFDTTISFRFLTRCYTADLEKLIKSFKTERAPDVIFISSCLWDISRWGPQGVNSYKDNVVKVMKLFKQYLPASTLVIWGTALPISSTVRSGFLIKQIEFLKHLLRFEVMEANTFARQVVVNYGYDVLDLHYHMRMQIHRRAGDGVHYLNLPVRLQTNLLLTHIALAWGESLPGKISNSLLEKTISNFNNEKLQRLDSKIPLVLKELNAVADKFCPEYGKYSPQRNQSNKRNNRRGKKNIEDDGFEQNDDNVCYNNNNNNRNKPKRKMKKRQPFGRRVNPY